MSRDAPADPPGQAAPDRTWDLLVDTGVPALRSGPHRAAAMETGR